MKSSLSAPIAVLGSGSWGTALAIQLARHHQHTRLWGHLPDEIAQMRKSRSNPIYLPDIAFPDDLDVYDDLEKALDGVTEILIVVPSHAFAQMLDRLKPLVTNKHSIVWATKGIDPKTGLLLHQVLQQHLPFIRSKAVLSGPSFAKEVAVGMPTAVTIASNDEHFSQHLVERFHTENFRPYVSDDIIGVQICGAVKNPVAVAAGIADGLGLGANARCALITRALAEMTRLGVAMGGKNTTFTGLAGLGDLVLTCTDNQSRNRRFGFALGQGKPIDEAEKEIGQVVEGKSNAILVQKLAKQYQVSMPIIDHVVKILEGKISPKDAVHRLLMRAVKAEVD